MSAYDFKVIDNYGDEVSLEDYKGKVLLIMNSATRCGFTPQYDALQDLYEKYGEDGFVILDFPCNQFGEQAIPLFKYLKEEKGFGGFDDYHELTPVLDKILSESNPDYKKDPSIKWNFTKFLIDREGNVAERFEPTKDFYEIEEKIKELL